MIDILYPLGEGSIWDNNEIRYSLRSLQKHLTGYRNIYIIGVLPDFLHNVYHIPYDDISIDKETNIYKKVERACQESAISQDFLFINDDHFFHKDCDATTFPFYYKGDILTSVQRLRDNNKYKRNLEKTMRTLHALGYDTKNFDIHTPIIYNKNTFLDIMPKYGWGTSTGFTVKSLYCNTLRIQGERSRDYKLGGQGDQYTVESIKDIIKDSVVWSIGNRTIKGGEGVQEVLNELYPIKSKWEK